MDSMSFESSTVVVQGVCSEVADEFYVALLASAVGAKSRSAVVAFERGDAPDDSHALATFARREDAARAAALGLIRFAAPHSKELLTLRLLMLRTDESANIAATHMEPLAPSPLSPRSPLSPLGATMSSRTSGAARKLHAIQLTQIPLCCSELDVVAALRQQFGELSHFGFLRWSASAFVDFEDSAVGLQAVQVGELRCLGYRIPMQFGPEATRKRIAPPPTAPLSPSLRYPERRDCPEFHVSNIKGDCPSDKVVEFLQQKLGALRVFRRLTPKATFAFVQFEDTEFALRLTADPTVDWTLFGRPIRFKLNSEARKSPLLDRLDLPLSVEDGSTAAVPAVPVSATLSPSMSTVQGLAVTDCRSCNSPNFVGFRFCQNCGIPSFNQ